MSPTPESPNQPPAKQKKQAPKWLKVFTKKIKISEFKKYYNSLLERMVKSLQKANRNDKIAAIILIIIWIAIILLGFVIKGSYVFEGNIIVKEISFTYTGKQEKRFLNTIRSVKNLDLQGSQKYPLVLTGKFSSADPVLNQKLSKLNKLTIELPYPNSRFILAPAKPYPTNELSIIELRINPQIQINKLAYNPQSYEISFCLQAVSRDPNACRFIENLSSNASNQSNINQVGKLQLLMGQQPIKISIEAFNLRELSIKTELDRSNEISFQFIPKREELLLNILSPTQVLMELSNTPKTAVSKKQNLRQWIRGDLDVKNVMFSRIENAEKVNDEIEISTISEGEIRMGSQTMKIQSDQFIIIPKNETGIRKIRSIEINSPSSEGLQTLISGESTSIAVGLYPEFPVQKIEPSWLSKYLSQETINAVLGFISALTAIVLPRLFPAPEKPEKPEKNPPTNP